METCATCRFWLSSDQKAGVCRRYPPTPMMLGYAPPSPIANPHAPPQPQAVIQSIFPNMAGNGSCGEYDDKEGLNS